LGHSLKLLIYGNNFKYLAYIIIVRLKMAKKKKKAAKKTEEKKAEEKK